MKKVLTIQAKKFIVKCLAMYDSPSEIVVWVKEKFEVTISRQGVQLYDPTTAAGDVLSTSLRKLFFETRREFEESAVLPLSKKNARIKRLSRYVEQAEKRGNYELAAAHLEQIAKEEGGKFTNRREVSGRNGEPITVYQMTIDEWRKLVAGRREQVLENV